MSKCIIVEDLGYEVQSGPTQKMYQHASVASTSTKSMQLVAAYICIKCEALHKYVVVHHAASQLMGSADVVGPCIHVVPSAECIEQFGLVILMQDAT